MCKRPRIYSYIGISGYPGVSPDPDMRDRMSKSRDEETKRDRADRGWMKDGDGNVGGGLQKGAREGGIARKGNITVD